MTFDKCHDHLSLIHAMSAAYPPHRMKEATVEAYMIALHDVPLEHCARAAQELLRKHDGEFIPSPGRWRSIAADFWNEAIVQSENSQRQIELQRPTKEQMAATRREFHLEIIERAKTDPFFADVMRSLDAGKLLKKPPRSTGEALAEINADMDREHAERLAKMTFEEREERQRFINQCSRPTKGGASLSSALYSCGWCGKAMKPGTEAYKGPAPGVEGDEALCWSCLPRCPWAHQKPQESSASAT